MSIWFYSFCCKWEGWDPVNRSNNTSWVALVTPTDRPKSEIIVKSKFWWRFYVVKLLFEFFSVGVGVFVIGLSQMPSFFSYSYSPMKKLRTVNIHNFAFLMDLSICTCNTDRCKYISIRNNTWIPWNLSFIPAVHPINVQMRLRLHYAINRWPCQLVRGHAVWFRDEVSLTAFSFRWHTHALTVSSCHTRMVYITGIIATGVILMNGTAKEDTFCTVFPADNQWIRVLCLNDLHT